MIPYVLMLVFGAMPLFYMEVILGQFNRQGPISLWRICPIFKGMAGLMHKTKVTTSHILYIKTRYQLCCEIYCNIVIVGVGYCAVFIAFYVSFYYNVIIGWSLYYAANSLTLTLPWTSCGNDWNTDYCTMKCDNTSEFHCNQTRSPATEYFK